MKTLGDMQKEIDFYGHYKVFEYNHEFEIFLRKIVHAKEMHLTRDVNVYLCLVDYYKLFF